MTLRYRAITVSDLPGVLEVRFSTRENRITAEELERDYGVTETTLAAALLRDVRGWLCEEGGTVVGFAMGERGSGEMLVLAVRPDCERRGIGRALLARVAQWLFDAGHAEIWLWSNPDPSIRAYGFYRALGWRETGRMRGEDEMLVLQAPSR